MSRPKVMRPAALDARSRVREFSSQAPTFVRLAESHSVSRDSPPAVAHDTWKDGVDQMIRGPIPGYLRGHVTPETERFYRALAQLQDHDVLVPRRQIGS